MTLNASTNGGGSEDRLTSPWKDITSHSQGAKDLTPKTWQAQFGQFRLVLTRHIDYRADQWEAYCPGVLPQKAMVSPNVQEAASQAKAALQEELEVALQEIYGSRT